MADPCVYLKHEIAKLLKIVIYAEDILVMCRDSHIMGEFGSELALK